MGLKPDEFFSLELWEFNSYADGGAEREKKDAANCILTGYYCAYYSNGGKKAKSPNELIKKLYTKKQSLSEGLKEIERIKKSEMKKEEL